MASIRQRTTGDGIRYQVLYRDADRRQRSETFASEKGAREFRQLLETLPVDEALAILDEREGAAPTAMLLSMWLTEYIATRTGITKGTRQRYTTYATKGLGVLPQRPLVGITRTTIAAWVNQLADEGLSGKTIANRHGFLSGALAEAVRAGHLTANPCEGTRLPKTVRQEMVFLTPDEFTLLLSYVRVDARDLVTVLVGTGMRWGEATSLQARDWDRRTRTLSIVRAWKFTETGERDLGVPKTTRSRRTIAVPIQVAEILNRLTADLKPEAFIFVNAKGAPWRAQAFYSAVWRPAVALANGEHVVRHRRPAAAPRLRKDGTVAGVRRPEGIPAPEGQQLGKRPRIHDLRHSCASWMIREGVALPVIQRHLGHESIQTTIDRYGHLEPAHLAAAAASLTNALGGTQRQINP